MALIGTNNIIQQQVMQNSNQVSYNGSSSFAEVSSSFRVSITPKFSSSLIHLEYFIPCNQTSSNANNLFGFKAYRISGGSGAGDVSSLGAATGSRKQMAGGLARSGNGADGNDHNMENWMAYDLPSTTSACVYGFHYFREDSDAATMFFGYSYNNNSTWGMASRIIITATEIAQ